MNSKKMDYGLLGASILANNDGRNWGSVLGSGLLDAREAMSEAEKQEFMRLMKEKQMMHKDQMLNMKQSMANANNKVTGGMSPALWRHLNPTQKPPVGMRSDGKGGWQWDKNYLQGKNQMAASGAPSIINQMPGQNQFDKVTGDLNAKDFDKSRQEAESAYKNNMVVDRFIENAAKPNYKGGVAPLMRAAGNFFSTFGYNSDELTNTNMMVQASSELLANQMADLGARGLTDKDMLILRDSLPKIDIDPDARMAVAQVLKKANEDKIMKYMERRNFYRKHNPDKKFFEPSWVESWQPTDFGTPQPASAAPTGGFKILGYE